MTLYSKDFEPFGERIWLNCAHQGPLPKTAIEKLNEAVKWKTNPAELDFDRFFDVPQRLRKALGRLINVQHEQIILGNSNSYGLHLLANGINWNMGDEIILSKGDFPSTNLPWLALEDKGVRINQITPECQILTEKELIESINGSTRLLCISWVNSFNGHILNVKTIGDICKANGIIFVLNCTQGLGALRFDVQATHVDAVSCMGAKWLLGPYGTGFCWMRNELMESLQYNHVNWLDMLTEDDLNSEIDQELNMKSGKKKYDVFGTANFFNFVPWTASIEYLLEKDVEKIEKYVQDLVSRFITKLDRCKFKLLSPEEPENRSSILFISHKDPGCNRLIYNKLLDENIFISLRNNLLRFSPHLYNTQDDIEKTVLTLNSF